MPTINDSKRQRLKCQLATETSRKWYRHLAYRAAVNILLSQNEHNDLQILMIKRAIFPGDRWSGQMGFPGGKNEPEDHSIRMTAHREMWEECGIDINQCSPLGRLSDVQAAPYKPMQKTLTISPFVYEAEAKLEFTLSNEVAKTFWIPLSIFTEENRQYRMIREHKLAYFTYAGEKIWGLSLMMIDELLSLLKKNEPA